MGSCLLGLVNWTFLKSLVPSFIATEKHSWLKDFQLNEQLQEKKKITVFYNPHISDIFFKAVFF